MASLKSSLANKMLSSSPVKNFSFCSEAIIFFWYRPWGKDGSQPVHCHGIGAENGTWPINYAFNEYILSGSGRGRGRCCTITEQKVSIQMSSLDEPCFHKIEAFLKHYCWIPDVRQGFWFSGRQIWYWLVFLWSRLFKNT